MAGTWGQKSGKNSKKFFKLKMNQNIFILDIRLSCKVNGQKLRLSRPPSEQPRESWRSIQKGRSLAKLNGHLHQRGMSWENWTVPKFNISSKKGKLMVQKTDQNKKLFPGSSSNERTPSLGVIFLNSYYRSGCFLGWALTMSNNMQKIKSSRFFRG